MPKRGGEQNGTPMLWGLLPRIYLGIVVLRFGGMALAYWAAAARLQGTNNYRIVERFAPLQWWIGLWAFGAAATFLAALSRTEWAVRLNLVISVFVSLIFGLSILIAAGHLSSPVGVAWLSFAATDLLVGGLPFARLPVKAESDRRDA